jgi:hypothetical protein
MWKLGSTNSESGFLPECFFRLQSVACWRCTALINVAYQCHPQKQQNCRVLAIDHEHCCLYSLANCLLKIARRWRRKLKLDQNLAWTLQLINRTRPFPTHSLSDVGLGRHCRHFRNLLKNLLLLSRRCIELDPQLLVPRKFATQHSAVSSPPSSFKKYFKSNTRLKTHKISPLGLQEQQLFAFLHSPSEQ